MMRPRHARAPRAHRGFILLTVIGLLIVLTLLAVAAATTANRIRDDQQQDDDRLRGELNVQSTQATLLYLLATQRMTFAGLTIDGQVRQPAYQKENASAKDDEGPSFLPVGNEIRLDADVYRGLGDSSFALQTDNGLLGVNWNPRLLQPWLDRLKIPSDEQVKLIAALLDYQDPDDLYRLNGAEADQYRQQKRLPPPNRTLLTPLELRRVMGWDKALESVGDDALMQTITVARDSQIDINAAPTTVLSLLPGVTPEMAQRVVDLRNVQAFSQLGDVYQLLPTLDTEADLISLYPGQSGTLDVWPDAQSGGRLMHWTLTPYDDGGSPWHIDYEFRIPARPDGGRTPARESQAPLLANPPAANP